MITPLRDWVLVDMRDATPSSLSNAIIQVVRLERPVSTYATVCAIGEDVRDVEVGARVVISRLQGIEIAGGALLIPESAVLAMESKEMTLAPECNERCQYAQDVSMLEHSCVGVCQYMLRPA